MSRLGLEGVGEGGGNSCQVDQILECWTFRLEFMDCPYTLSDLCRFFQTPFLVLSPTVQENNISQLQSSCGRMYVRDALIG